MIHVRTAVALSSGFDLRVGDSQIQRRWFAGFVIGKGRLPSLTPDTSRHRSDVETHTVADQIGHEYL
jgi:hypothetical protein